MCSSGCTTSPVPLSTWSANSNIYPTGMANMGCEQANAFYFAVGGETAAGVVTNAVLQISQ